MAECYEFVNKIKEDRHFKTPEWQKAQYERLCMKRDDADQGGHSMNVNMHRYMHQSGSDNLSQTDHKQVINSTGQNCNFNTNSNYQDCTKVNFQVGHLHVQEPNH